MLLPLIDESEDFGFGILDFGINSSHEIPLNHSKIKILNSKSSNSVPGMRLVAKLCAAFGNPVRDEPYGHDIMSRRDTIYRVPTPRKKQWAAWME
jgi:hypothetical protein